MNTGQLLQTLIVSLFGGLLGGAIAILTAWLRRRQDSETSTKEWYEQTYIRDGIDPLIAYLIGLEFRLVMKTENIKMNVPNDPVPVNSIAGIHFLFGQTMLLETVGLVHWCIDNEENQANAREIAGIVMEIVHVLLNCRDELLTDISEHARNKLYQVHPSATSITQLEKICKRLHEVVHHDIVFLHPFEMEHAER